MRALLDTHALIWWFEDPALLGAEARELLQGGAGQILVSAVSAFEMNTKRRIGKLLGIDSLIDDLANYVAEQGFELLPVTLDHAELGGRLDIPHRDPFDRLLIAQALIEDVRLVSNERPFDSFGVRRLW